MNGFMLGNFHNFEAKSRGIYREVDSGSYRKMCRKGSTLRLPAASCMLLRRIGTQLLLIVFYISLFFILLGCGIAEKTTIETIGTEPPERPERATEQPEQLQLPEQEQSEFINAESMETPEATSAGTNNEVQVPRSWSREFSTDFSKFSVDVTEVIAGGPPKDGIPSIDKPLFESISDADKWLDSREPVIVVQTPESAPSGEVKIYPLQILTWHEIVNDTINGHPITVTYCPLCNTGVVFMALVKTESGTAAEPKEKLEFGVTGFLRYSNMIMYDRQTESWWQQATGEAIAGVMTGKRLTIHPSLTLSFSDAKSIFPKALVLSRETGYSRPYGTNPYVGYDSKEIPFLYQGPEVDSALRMLEQVIVVKHGDDSQAVPYSQLQEEGVVQFLLDGRKVAVFWKEGTASALDSRQIAQGRDIGSGNAFFTEVDQYELNFVKIDTGFRDLQTGSHWNEAGIAIKGPLQGTRLPLVTAVQHFWFSYYAFSREF